MDADFYTHMAIRLKAIAMRSEATAIRLEANDFTATESWAFRLLSVEHWSWQLEPTKNHPQDVVVAI